jgi:predicted RNA-binding protein with PIN domain
MKIVVDGYNVLKQVMRSKQIDEHDKINFLKRLDRYARSKKHDIVVVFDGGEQGLASKEFQGTVLVFYSGARESADDLIVRRLENLKEYHVMLVSSDRELRQKAAHFSIDSIAALDFYELLRAYEQHTVADQKMTGGSLVKTSKSKNTELDELMRQATGHIPQKKGEERNEAAGQRGKTLSKEERKLMQKVKKL